MIYNFLQLQSSLQLYKKQYVNFIMSHNVSNATGGKETSIALHSYS